MISISPPQVKPYAPATKPIAFVNVALSSNELAHQVRVQIQPLDADRKPIAVDVEALPNRGQLTPAQQASLAAPFAGALATDTLHQATHRRALGIVEQVLGVKGSVE
jgi:hypothetical protein